MVRGSSNRRDDEGVELGLTTEYLLREQLAHVYAALTPENRAVCRVCVHTGLRLGDVLQLRTDQIARQFWVTERKTGKRRRVGLTDELIAEVMAFAGPVWAFPGRKGDKPRTRQAVWADVKRAAKAFRLPQNVAPHSFRKVYAVELLRRYGDVERVRKALNHSDFATTMVYAMAAELLEAKGRKRGGRRGG